MCPQFVVFGRTYINSRMLKSVIIANSVKTRFEYVLVYKIHIPSSLSSSSSYLLENMTV